MSHLWHLLSVFRTNEADDQKFSKLPLVIRLELHISFIGSNCYPKCATAHTQSTLSGVLPGINRYLDKVFKYLIVFSQLQT